MIITKNGFFSRQAPVILGHGRIMLARRIDIRVTENIRHQIDVTGFTVQICSEGTAEFMRADL